HRHQVRPAVLVQVGDEEAVVRGHGAGPPRRDVQHVRRRAGGGPQRDGEEFVPALHDEVRAAAAPPVQVGDRRDRPPLPPGRPDRPRSEPPPPPPTLPPPPAPGRRRGGAAPARPATPVPGGNGQRGGGFLGAPPPPFVREGDRLTGRGEAALRVLREDRDPV